MFLALHTRNAEQLRERIVRALMDIHSLRPVEDETDDDEDHDGDDEDKEDAQEVEERTGKGRG